LVTGYAAGSFNRDAFFVEEDTQELESLLTELAELGLAENEWSSIEDPEDESEEQFHWHFALPVVDKLKEPNFVALTLARLKTVLVLERSFEDRANALIVYFLERILSLGDCAHIFVTNRDFIEECKNCGGLVSEAEEFMEIFS
jgi:hypothetical protein